MLAFPECVPLNTLQQYANANHEESWKYLWNFLWTAFGAHQEDRKERQDEENQAQDSRKQLRVPPRESSATALRSYIENGLFFNNKVHQQPALVELCSNHLTPKLILRAAQSGH